MRFLQKYVAFAVLAGFIGLVSAEAYHTHKAALVQAENACAVCKLAHQTPLIASVSDVPRTELAVTGAAFAPPPLVEQHTAFTSHGLSPPVAL